MLSTRVAVKRVLLGRPRPSRQLREQLLPKRVALPVLGSDPLSSVAYASHELVAVLALAGAGALALASPLALGVVALLALVVTSYRRTVRAYPHGGGAYIAAKDNLGTVPALVAAGALLVGYALTVAVSIAFAVATLVAAFPELAGQRVLLGLALLAVVTFANLRGVREASLLLAVPAYAFLAALLALFITGVVRCGLGVGGCPSAPSAGTELPAVEAVTLFLLLRAFTAGGALLGGVEAFSNAVTAFRYPQSRNAARCLALAGLLAGVAFVGLALLASATGVVARSGADRTVIAEIALALFGEGVGFLLVQLATVAVLVVAASTSYADFPRLASVLARDRWLPRQFLARGDRLVFSNGILLLGLGAAALLVAYRVALADLVQLYVLAVFAAFALCLAGMARRHSRLRERGWQRAAAADVVGATACAGVVLVALASGDVVGVLLVAVAVATLAGLMWAVHRHYRAVGLRLQPQVTAAELLAPQQALANHAVILLDRVDEAAARALSYALATGAVSIRALGLPLPRADLQARWATLAPDVPLEMLQGAKDPGTDDALVEALSAHADRNGGDAFTTAIIPETLSRSWFDQLREHRLALRVKAKLQAAGRVVVTDVTSPVGGPGPYTVEEPVEHHVVVLVSAVDAATIRALAYADGLHASSVRALAVNLDPERSTALLSQWADWGLATPVEVVDSPFRSLTGTVRDYVRGFGADGRHTVVTCVLPTFVTEHWLQEPLHNQSAMLLRSTFLFERGVATTSVPYPLSGALPSAAGSAAESPAG